MSDKVSDWKMMWGAKVKNPCDVPDDILKDAISASIQILSTINSSASEAEESRCIEKIKTHMDENWEPGWMVVVGRSFRFT